MRRIPHIFILFILALCLPGLSQQHLNKELATWEAIFDFGNELYPSYVLATSGMRHESSDPYHFGDNNGMAEVWIVSSVPNVQVRVEIQIEGWTEKSVLEATLPEAGKRYKLAPIIRYDFTRLMEINQSIPANVLYSVRMDETDLGQEVLSIRVRSVNDVPIATRESTLGGERDLTFLFAAYVNESHPIVQEILQEALQWKAVNSFAGYQVDPEGVRMQVFAIWNVLQRRHVRYSSTTTTSAESPSGQVLSQSVRFLDQSFDSQQANCVDGSVLFASVLYKIGIEPVLVLMPGHMFVGYWMDKSRKLIELLETTAIGIGPLPSSSNLPFSNFLHPVKLSNSWAQFLSAIQTAENRFVQEVYPALQKEGSVFSYGSLYKMIDIASIRKIGINAIPRPGR